MINLGKHIDIQGEFKHYSGVHITEKGTFIYSYRMETQKFLCHKVYTKHHSSGFYSNLLNYISYIILIGEEV